MGVPRVDAECVCIGCVYYEGVGGASFNLDVIITHVVRRDIHIFRYHLLLAHHFLDIHAKRLTR